ncbi:hypothetical protein [Halolamina rubra]|uniref:hypothetical protein n=1 Tax=Halolamina rubra TaxID=1380430 RepID=UPI000678F25D|nr:hypothetical protein [Halolamina rubra]
MRRNTATINYGIGSLFGNTFNMYVFGSAILTTLNFLLGLLQTQTFEGALNVAINYYISKLTPFPINEFLAAGGFWEVMFNVSIALGLGLLVAMYRYRKNRF